MGDAASHVLRLRTDTYADVPLGAGDQRALRGHGVRQLGGAVTRHRPDGETPVLPAQVVELVDVVEIEHPLGDDEACSSAGRGSAAGKDHRLVRALGEQRTASAVVVGRSSSNGPGFIRLLSPRGLPALGIGRFVHSIHCRRTDGHLPIKRSHKKSEPSISLADPDPADPRQARQARRFGYVTQLCEVTPNTKRGAHGLILPPATAPGNPTEDALLPQTVTELCRLGALAA